MPWQFQQSTGQMTDPDGNLIETGYSGNGEGLCNPDMQFVHGVGPIPQGTYTIGPPKDPIDILGPIAMPLTPDPSNDMEGRNSFFIHGDNAACNHTASDGCIIMSHDTRVTIDESDDKTLIVIA